LAVANNGSATVSVYRNTSTSGSIVAGSFAAKVDFTTGTLPRSVTIGDLNGDGKPDLAVANSGSATVSVYRNTSTSGSIVAGSFAARVNFTTGSDPRSVAIGDLDGDGKPDLVVANVSSNSVSVLRNADILSSNAFLSALAVSTGTLSPTFAAATTAYTASVTNVTTSVTVTPTRAEANATIQVRVNGGAYASVTSGSASSALSLNVGSNTIDVLVTAQDGTTTNSYSITVTRISNDATLSALTTTAGTLSPTFASGTISYTTASVCNATTSVTVTPTRTEANASIQVRVNGGAYASVTSGSASSALSLNVGSNTIDVLVTAQDGTTTNSYTLTVTVNTNSTAAVLSGTASICSGSSANLSVAITGGTSPFTVVYSDGTSNFTVNSYTSGANIAVSPTSTTNYSLVSVTSTGGCVGTNNSGTPTVTVNATTVGGSLIGNQTVCPNTQPTDLTLSGNTGVVVKWQSATNTAFTGATDVANTTTTLTGVAIGNVAVTTYYRAVVQSGSCTIANSTTAIIEIRTAIYNGTTWSIPPTANTALVIAGSYSAPGNLEGCSCTINPGITMTIGTGDTLTLKDALTNNGASMTFENGASLLQTSGVTNNNTGNVIYKRNTSVMLNNFDFTYWSSPVAAQTLGSIWMSVNSNDTFYTWTGATSTWTPATAGNTMNAGVGYIARSRNNGIGTDFAGNNTTYTAPGAWLAKFNGVPNSGDIDFSVSGTGLNKDNLMGNPYPSALDIISFRNDPSNSARLTGNFYFWTHTNAINNNTYNASDYAIFNVALNAGVGTTAGSTPAPDSYVDSGQGFFAEGATNGTVTFKNSHRVSGFNNAFYRTNSNNNATQTTLESSKIWLNLTNTQGLIKQQLLTYTQGATMGYDPTLDAKTFEGNSFIDFYSNAASEKLTIQSRALPFANTDLVPVGFKTSVAGAYTIAIDHFDGLFVTQTVFIQDNLLNIDHNLSLAPYNFSTLTGTFNNRFVLKYTSATLGNNDPTLDLSNVIVAKIDNSIKIKSTIQNIDKILIFDLLGRKVFEQNKVNSKQFETKDLVLNQQTLIVKVILEDGLVVSRKIVY
jgi:hypothetical protein